MTTRAYVVPGISCDHCKQTIEGTVGAIADVVSVTVDVAARTVVVEGDASEAAILAAIADAGYEVAGHRLSRSTGTGRGASCW